MKRNIVITGGSQGLGKAVAIQLKNNKDNNVIVVANDLENLENTAKELGVNFFVADVTDFNHVELAVKEITKAYGNIDVLINNAGIFSAGPFDSQNYEQIKNVINVNTLGTLYFSKAVIPGMKEKKQGVILNVVSIHGLEVRENRALYCASKWAVTGFSEALAIELAPFGIKVVAIFPSRMKTNMYKNYVLGHPDMSVAMDPIKVAEVIEQMIEPGKVALTKVVIKDMAYGL